MSEGIIQRAFAAGELSGGLAARADLGQYQAGLRRCRNFIVQRNGGIANRPGFRFVSECKDNAAGKRLIRFVTPEPALSVLIEAGADYLRFYQDGAVIAVDGGDVDAWDSGTDYGIGDLVTSGGDIYYATAASLASGPPSADWHALAGGVFELPFPLGGVAWNVSQSGNVLTFTSKDAAPMELIYLSPTRWIFQPISTAPVIGPPENVVLTAGAGTRSYGYVVTAAHPLTYEESVAGAQTIDASAATPTPDAPHGLVWDAVLIGGVNAPEYYVYCDPYGNGTYGYIGTATGLELFNNPGIEPDFAVTPPLERILFDADDLYPHVSANFQQRRVFGHTHEVPDGLWFSKTGLLYNFGITSPLQDDDAITVRIAGNNNHPIRHLVALKAGLVVMTDGGEWTCRGPEGRAITPNGVEFEQQTYNGIAAVPPVVVGNAVLYLQARGAIVRDLRFDAEVEGLAGRDLTTFAGHLFDGYTIVSMDYAQTPNSIIWCARSDGMLLGLTYLREQEVWGWHRHDTDGAFEALCVMPEAGEDALYAIVGRTVGGVVKRFIEKLESRTIIDWNADAFFLDAGLSYQGSAVSSVSGLEHLDGATVGIVGDGTYRGTAVVSGGAVSVPGAAAEDIHVGLLYVADLETLTLDVAGSAVRDKKKAVKSVTMILDRSDRSWKVGRSFTATLSQHRLDTVDGTAASFTGDVQQSMLTGFGVDGRFVLRHTTPLPLHILGVVPQVEVLG